MKSLESFPEGKLIIFSAPSGSGKTTIVRHLLECNPNLAFSISATSRAPRNNERDAYDYYFLSESEFNKRIQNGDFLEWEEVYEGTYYGTLASELARIWGEGKNVIFDMDVVGGINLKKLFGERALAVFVMPPGIEALEHRLRQRKTETEEKIQQRLSKAREELARAAEFDQVLINEDLELAKQEAQEIVQAFVSGVYG